MKSFVFGKRSRDNLSGVKPEVEELVTLALKYSTIDFSVIDGFRTAAQQAEMFESGASELDGVNSISDHQIGMAIDVIPVMEKSIWDVNDSDVASAWLEVYRAFMRAGMKLGLILEFGVGYNVGGGRDYPHISVKGSVR